MSIGKLLYEDLPKFFSALWLLRSTSKVHSRGLTFKLVSDNWITKYRARSFNSKEPEMLDWLDENLQNGDVFFDVGANVGIYSIYAALRNTKAMVYAYEPEYSNLHQLKMNIINNHLMDSVIPYSVAFSDKTEITHLHIQDITPGAALHTASSEELEKTQSGQPVLWKEGIACMTLDDFCDFVGIKPNLVKIDVDGNETSILKGGQQTFSNPDLRTVFIEVDAKQHGCEKILTGYGFILFDKFGVNQIWKRPD